MTVYELIQKLTEFPPEKEIVIDFNQEITGYIDNIEDYMHEGYRKVHIICAEV